MGRRCRVWNKVRWAGGRDFGGGCAIAAGLRGEDEDLETGQVPAVVKGSGLPRSHNVQNFVELQEKKLNLYPFYYFI